MFVLVTSAWHVSSPRCNSVPAPFSKMWTVVTVTTLLAPKTRMYCLAVLWGRWIHLHLGLLGSSNGGAGLASVLPLWIAFAFSLWTSWSLLQPSPFHREPLFWIQQSLLLRFLVPIDLGSTHLKNVFRPNCTLLWQRIGTAVWQMTEIITGRNSKKSISEAKTLQGKGLGWPYSIVSENESCH